MSENDKDKENKKTSEIESYDEYEGEGMEDAAEGSGLEGISSTQIGQNLDFYKSSTSIESKSESSTFDGSYEEKRRLLLREKWMSVTGKKPKSIPTVRKPLEEGLHKHVFFGDRKPLEVEKNIRRRLLSAAYNIESKDLKFGKVKREIMLPALFSGLLCIRFDPIAEYMTCSNRKGGVQVRECSTGEVLFNLKTIEESEKMGVNSVRYYPNDGSRVYVVGNTGSIQVFNTRTGSLIACSEPFGSMYNMDISPDGDFLAMGGKEGQIYIFDPETLQLISKRGWPSQDEQVQGTVNDEYHKMRIYGMKFHPTEPNIFATGSWDNTVKIWDVRIQPAIRCIKDHAVFGDGVDLRDNFIITATWRAEKSLNLWDFQSAKLIKNIPIRTKSTKFEGEYLYTCRYFHNNEEFPMVNSKMVAIGGSGFSDVLVMDIETDQIHQYFPSFKPIMCLDICGNLIAYGGTESVYRVAEVESKRTKQTTKR